MGNVVNVGTPIVNTNPTQTTFTAPTITTSATIDFSSHVSDPESTDANLKIKPTALPTKGVLTVNGSNAAINTQYGVNVITYTSNASECAASYTDSFTYKVVDQNGGESAEGTVNISANAHNCVPTSSTFTEALTSQSGTIDFSSHVADNETADGSLKIILTTLPSGGTLTVSGSNAAINTDYDVNVLTYTTSSSASSQTDSFNYKVKDASSAESTVGTCN